MDYTGRSLGVYHLVARIGVGGTATVYRATHLCDPRKEFAVKVLHRNSDQTAVRRFYREIELARRIHSLNAGHHITRVYDHNQEDGLHWAAMELLQGKTLRDILLDIEPGKLRWEDASYVILNVCAALTTMHDLGIVHRDIKPENIFVARAGAGLWVKLLDLGLARMVSETNAPEHLGRLTKTNEINGTIQYMSPERIMGDAGSPAGDQYALGVTLYECIHGRLPFLPGEEDRLTATRTLRWQERVPREMRLIAHRALAQTAQERFPSVRALGKAVHACLDRTQDWFDSKKALLELLARPNSPGSHKPVLPSFDSVPTRRHPHDGGLYHPTQRFGPATRGEPVSGADPRSTEVDDSEHASRTSQSAVTEPQPPRCALLVAHGARLLWLMKLSLVGAMIALVAMAEVVADVRWVRLQKWLRHPDHRQPPLAGSHPEKLERGSSR